VFTGSRGNLVIIAWSTTAFVSAAVAAGGMGIIVDSEGINIDRDIAARRFVRGFAISSAILTLAGILLLSIAMAGLDPAYGDVSSRPSTRNERAGMRAAGWFTVAMVVGEIAVAVGVRIKYATTTYHW